MRQMSFAFTKDQVRAGTKTVTRRLGWATLLSGQRLIAVEKSQGLAKGERVIPIRPIRVLSVRQERLDRMLTDPNYGHEECVLEGFPHLGAERFVAMFCRHNRCVPSVVLTRVQFDYDVPPA